MQGKDCGRLEPHRRCPVARVSRSSRAGRTFIPILTDTSEARGRLNLIPNFVLA